VFGIFDFQMTRDKAVPPDPISYSVQVFANEEQRKAKARSLVLQCVLAQLILMFL